MRRLHRHVGFVPTRDSCTAAIVASRSSGSFLSRANARSRPKGDLEKIKTIGDAYMVAAGLPEPRPNHAQAAIEMAMAMQRDVDISPQAMIPPGGA
jgi:class 3 adenylate cyclase